MSTYSLKYGRETVNFDVPQNWQTRVLKHSEPKPVPLQSILSQALKNSIGSLSFNDWAKQFKNLLIIVPDVTRYAGMERILPILFDEYLQGVNTDIIFALGNHRKQSAEEM
jgi:nickel-dependent lactate racemase